MLTNLLKPKQRQIDVECVACKRSVKLERSMRLQPLSRDVVDVGILCPHCYHWTHSFYETRAIKVARAQLNTVKGKPGVTPEEVQTAQAFFESAFKLEQERVKAEL